MKIYSLHARQLLPVALEEAWDFFSDPRNLNRITPESLDFAITSRLPERMYAGLVITYRIKVALGIPATWVTEITHVREPELFVDEQRIGPYRFWHHQHHLRETGAGVEAEDIVHYALPFGPLGRIVHACFVKRKLGAIFEYRRRALEKIFGSADSG
jgi:ligand-binding SRPBCC domain-containing protein